MKKIRYYSQHTLETCGISCALMALDYFKIDFPTVAKEMSMYRKYKAEAEPGTLCSAIAYELSRHNLSVSLVHSGEELIENHEGYYPEHIHRALLDEYTRYIERADGKIDVRLNARIDCDALRDELAQDRLVILQCLVEGNADGLHDHVLHGVLLYDYEDGLFRVCDPIPSVGRHALTEAQLEQAMQTPVGRVYISVGKKAPAPRPQ